MSKLALLSFSLPGLSLFIYALNIEDLPSPATLIIPGLVIAILIVFNGLFVAAEFAISNVRATQMEEIANEGNKMARRILSILESAKLQDRYIATAQLGITVASLGLGMYGEPQVAHFIEPYLTKLTGAQPGPALIHSISSIIALGLLTYLHVVIGEMVPKSIALNQSKKTVLAIARPMRLMEFIFDIPVKALNSIGRFLLLILHIPPGESRLHSPEEIEQIVSESAEKGLLSEDEGEFIRNIFTFSDRQVHQVMTPRRRIQSFELNTPLPELFKAVSTSNHSRFPVYENDLDHIIGILHLKDLIRQRLKNKDAFDLRLIINPAPVIPENYPVKKLLASFKQQRIHMGIVLDEFGGTAGIVTLEDLLEEVVGEVRDEFDKEEEPFIRLTPNSVEVSGQFLLEDLVEETSLNLETEKDLPDIETVGGLIITELGRPPQVGDQLSYGPNINITVKSVDGLAVTRARIDYELPTESAEEEDNIRP